MGSYTEWDEEKKLEFLTRELKGKRPLVSPTIEVSYFFKFFFLSSFLLNGPGGEGSSTDFRLEYMLSPFC